MSSYAQMYDDDVDANIREAWNLAGVLHHDELKVLVLCTRAICDSIRDASIKLVEDEKPPTPGRVERK